MLRITASLRNVSSDPVADLSVQLRYRPQYIGSRNEFDSYACGTPCPPNGGGSPVPLPPVVASTATVSLPATSLAPRASETVTVSVPVDDLQLPRIWEVYELGLQVDGSTPIGFQQAIGGLRTFLPWAPIDDTGAGYGVPTALAWVWPLADRPHRTVGSTWTDDGLATEISAGGRLATLLGVGMTAEEQQSGPAPKRSAKQSRTRAVPVPVQPVPVSWAVDPLLVEDVHDMADGYRVGAGRPAVAGTGTDDARSWLALLQRAAGKGETLPLPYGDMDVVAATRGHLGNEVQVAINSGTTVLSQLTGITPLSYVSPPNGLLDQRTLDTLFAAGAGTVVLDGRALPPVTEQSVTPSAHATVRARDGNLDALLTDDGLDAVIAIGAQDPAKQPLAVQRFLSELLMIQAELPSKQRTLVVAPDRRWAPSATYAQALLSGSGKVPWIQPVPLSHALADTTSLDVERQPLNYPAVVRRAELPPRYVEGVAALKSSADRFAAILPTPGDSHARAFDDAVLRTLSSSWRGAGPQRQHYRELVAGALDTEMRRVRIASASGSFVTLTSHSGTVPVTVSNELDTPVRVLVRINAGQRLRVSGGGRTAQTIPAHRQVAVDVRADARTSGVFPLTVQLLTPTAPYSVYDQKELFVRSTAYGSVAILTTAGATGVLLFAVAVRLVRRARAARRSAART